MKFLYDMYNENNKKIRRENVPFKCYIIGRCVYCMGKYERYVISLFRESFYTYSEKRHRTPTFQSTVRYIGLFREIGGVLDRRYHPLDR